MSEFVRIGILGAGGILGAHAPGYWANTDRCKVVAVADPRAECAPRIRELFGDDVRIESDYHDVLAAPDIDAVDIILPHNLHMPATLAAAKAGKPVLVEKVMARNIDECDRMIAACDAAGVSLTVCHDRRYHGEWMALKQVVDSGLLGEIFWWKLDHNQDVEFPSSSWARLRDALGGGAIMSCLTHQIDSLRWYGGEVDSLTCMTKVIPERMEGEFAGVIAARMASGALAHLSINWWTRSNTLERGLWYEMVQVCGSAGEAYYMSGKGTFVNLRREPRNPPPWVYDDHTGTGFSHVRSGEWSGHVGCITEWLKSLRGEACSISTDGRSARGTVEVAEAAYLSESTERTVHLPIQPTPWPDAANEGDA
jgi:UDP-N-acetyl-2-amino-2-deoxyglucuronate dehydrogenase